MSTPPVNDTGRSMGLSSDSSTSRASGWRRTEAGSVESFARFLRGKSTRATFLRVETSPAGPEPRRAEIAQARSRSWKAPPRVRARAALARRLNDRLSIMAMLVFPSHVRERILEQHGELRTLLHRAIDAPEVASSGAATVDCAQLRAIGLELCDRLRQHLVFEADALRPVFAVLDYWGPERIRELDIEHARQREELDALRCKLDSADDLQELSADLSKLAGELLKDMDAEEDGCLRATLLCDVSLTVERR